MPSTLPDKKKKKHDDSKGKRKRQDREESGDAVNIEREDKKRQKKDNDDVIEVTKPLGTQEISNRPETGQVQEQRHNVDITDAHIDNEERGSNNKDVDEDETPMEREEDQGLVAFPRLAQPAGPSKDELKRLEDMTIPEWLSHPTVVSPDQTCELDKVGLSERIISRCKDLGLVNFFAVQMTVIPVFLRRQALYDTHRPPGDLCISAPTGSGKTLAYVLPVVDILSKRVVPRLRALVVLPTRDLVIQVKETFDAFVKGTDLKVAAVYGQHSFVQEQQMLVGKSQDGYPGGQSRVDILIATPGRLTDHIRETRNFTLQHLRFLVIDEADRLLNQSYNDWLNQILAATRPTVNPDAPSLTFKKDEFGVNEPDAISPAFLNSHYTLPKTDLDMPKVPSIQKLLFSATLTKNPAKIAGLHLMNPEYISIQRSTLDGDIPAYTTPAGLKEYMTVCSSERKPLTFIYLVHQFNIKSCLCFTKSVESTKRLQTLVEAFEERQSQWPKVTVAEYSSELPMNERKSMLRRFRNGEINILVCSDLIGRGIDLDTVQVVVSYDVPWFMEKYIHRVGRTARAGREGEAYTLVETQEARPFKDVLKNASHLQQVKNLKVDKAKLAAYQADYDAALSSLE